MYIGHLAAGFAAKRAAPRTSLGTLIAAACFIDLLWPIFLALGWERVRIDRGNTAFTPLDFESYPWSHSLAMTLLWSIVAGAAYFATRRYRRGAVVVGLLVTSHWVLDAATHRPDLPLWPGGGERIGLGLWNSIPATMIVESAMYAAALVLYARSTRPNDRVGTWAFWTFAAIHVLFWATGPFGPPPPSATAVMAVTFATFVFPLWAAWFDRHRSLTLTPSP